MDPEQNLNEWLDHPVAVRLESERRLVLDLSANNRLLNHRTLRSRGLQLVDERADAVFDLLVENEAAMSFASADRSQGEALSADENGSGSSFAFRQPSLGELDANTTSEKHRDSILQTPYDDVELQRRLLNTYYSSQRIIQERGVNTLFVAFGFLQWVDRSSNEQARTRSAPLILVPVTIDRSSASARFLIGYTGEDISTNLSLAEKLRLDFGIALPEITADVPVAEYLRAVQRMKGIPDNWTVTPDLSLDFFSYTRFQIYQDLDPVHWNRQIAGGDGAVARLIGSESFATEYAPPYEIDSDLDITIKAEDIIHVADADSSQMVAIRRVLDGNDLIIQGPPGTGKSQTITNIIAACIAAGKRVLFVSEKKAALDVVYSNLSKLGLDRIALRLHSHRASKKEVLLELERTLRSRPSTDGERTPTLRAMRRFKQTLQDYSESMVANIDGFAANTVSVIDILSEARIRLAEFESPDSLAGEFAACTRESLRDVEEITSDLQSLLAGNVGLPIDHPFWGTGITSVMPETEALLRTQCTQVLELLEQVGGVAKQLTEATQGAVGDRLADLWVLSGHANAVHSCPIVSEWVFDPVLWHDHEARRRTILRTGMRVRKTFEELGDYLLPGAWSRDVRMQHANVSSQQGRLFRWFRRDYRQSSKELRGLFRGSPPKEVGRMLEYSQLIIDYQDLTDSIRQAPESIGAVFGDSWRGVHSDFADLLEGLDVIEGVLSDVESGRVQSESIRFLSDRKSVAKAARVALKLIPALEVAEISIQDLYDALKLPPLDFDDVRSLTRPDLYDYVHVRRAQIHRLSGYVAYARERGKLKGRGLHALAAGADTWPYASRRLTEFAQLSWAKDAYRAALQQFPDLQDFNRDLHEKAVDKFAKTDVALLRENRFIVAREHVAGMPRYPAGQLSVLLREFEKRRSHKPVRQLVSLAGSAIQRIKPLFMMSPLSVATYLPPDSVEFDLVVFDEASQIRPIDAFGAILRSRQVVIVGDKQQLPPTNFFVTDGHEDQEDGSMAEIESILGLAAAHGCPSSMLTWHYRSRHESLISISNKEFYDSRLFVFPSPSTVHGIDGLQFQFVPGSVYESGAQARFNAGEARAIARQALRHVRENPDKSLGIVAFGSGQRDRILAEIESLRRESAEIDAFETRHPDEPLFVKNLENVQGDERDVMFISVGYGKKSDGSLSHNFGPINQDGGARRLNVVFSRARQRCLLFANFRHESLDLERTASRGVAVLKEFMRYADTNAVAGESAGHESVLLDPETKLASTDAAISVHEADDLSDESIEAIEYQTQSVADLAGTNDSVSATVGSSGFTSAIRLHLESRGYSVEESVGESAFRIDLAIRHQAYPERFVLAVQTDGPRYHGTRWTRSRDRLQKSVLSRKGWRTHDVWAPDWYRDPEAEVDRIEKQIRHSTELGLPDSNASHRDASSGATFKEPSAYVSSTEDVMGPAITTRYLLWPADGALQNKTLPDVDIDAIINAVAAIAAVESPIHVDELIRRLRDASDSSRVGTRLREVVSNAVGRAHSQRLIVVDGSFIWSGSVKQSVDVRDRNALPDDSRQIGYIHENEIATAFDRVVLGTGGISQDDAVREVRRLFGYARASAEIDERLEQVLMRMIDENLLINRNGLLSL